MKHPDNHNTLTDQQHGFKKQRSTESQLLLTLQDLSSALEQVDAILLDSVGRSTWCLINDSSPRWTTTASERQSEAASRASCQTEANRLLLKATRQHPLQSVRDTPRHRIRSVAISPLHQQPTKVRGLNQPPLC